MSHICILFILLFVLEICYFKAAERFNIVDKPNERSSHTRVVLRGGGIIFTIALWLWSVMYGFHYPWMLAGVTLAAGISFIDDIRSLPDSVRLGVQFVSVFLILQDVGFLRAETGELEAGDLLLHICAVLAALIVCVGCVNIYNFMDGINGITGGYSMAMLIPLYLLNGRYGFVEDSLLAVIGMSVLVFCLFNFRKRAKCFAGDVGSIGIALILTFCMARLMLATGDVAWMVLFLVYGADGMMTILHRIQLRENLGQAHRKHAYQLMANELKIPHVIVATIYMVMQLVISLVAIYVIPDSVVAHWCYFVGMVILMGGAYILFMRKFYHLHEEYLASLK